MALLLGAGDDLRQGRGLAWQKQQGTPPLGKRHRSPQEHRETPALGNADEYIRCFHLCPQRSRRRTPRFSTRLGADTAPHPALSHLRPTTQPGPGYGPPWSMTLPGTCQDQRPWAANSMSPSSSPPARTASATRTRDLARKTLSTRSTPHPSTECPQTPARDQTKSPPLESLPGATPAIGAGTSRTTAADWAASAGAGSVSRVPRHLGALQHGH